MPAGPGSLLSGPPASFASPTSASELPSIIPSAPGPECSTDDNKPGNRLVAISCPASEKKLAALMLATAGLSQPPASSRSPGPGRSGR